MGDERQDYGPAGCMDGCAKTLSGTALIGLLVVAVLRALLRRGGGRRG